MPKKIKPRQRRTGASHPTVRPAPRGQAWLGVECGGTRTVVLLVPVSGASYCRAELGPANLRLLDDAALSRHFKAIKSLASAPLAGIAIGMAGARTDHDRRRILEAASRVWPQTPCYPTNDLETALMAAEPAGNSLKLTKILVLSGTGSCCFGRAPDGKTARVGGWGHILGDRGSGYEIGLRSLQAVLRHLDRHGNWPPLGETILRCLQWNTPEDLIDWVKNADKSEVAALAKPVFDAAAKGDRIAREILDAAAASLAADAVDCAQRLAKSGAPVEYIFSGGILLQQPAFARKVAARLRRLWPRARITPLPRESAWGAIQLAKEKFPSGIPITMPLQEAKQHARHVKPISALPPTEQVNPRSRNLDSLPLPKAVALMIREESRVGAAIFKERRKIVRAIEIITGSLRRGGRLFYIGAGTSGRLGVLDAAECPPTFRLEPRRIQGIIAGGRTALWRSVEGAEDDSFAGAAAIAHRGVNKRDVVVGIAASGRTPFVWGALEAAKARGTTTILLCFNPATEIPAGRRASLVIAPDTGPELLTGSTRLKAGTATKLILNMFTTLAMVRLGKVAGNLMVDLNPSNEKLRARAVRIVRALTGAGAPAARAALEKARWNVRACLNSFGRPAAIPPALPSSRVSRHAARPSSAKALRSPWP